MDEMDSARLIAILAGCFSGLILGGLGAAITLIAGYFGNQARRSRRWPSTLGTVVASAAHAQRAEDGGASYYPAVTYTYTVAGRAYTGSRVAFGLANTNAYSSPDRAVAQYVPGRPLTVYYDPRHPAEAVLERRAANAMLWVIAIVIFVIAAVFPILFVLAGLAAMNGG